MRDANSPPAHDRVFALSGRYWDRAHLEHLEVVRFKGYHQGMEFRPAAQRYPSPLVMQGDLTEVANTDYPYGASGHKDPQQFGEVRGLTHGDGGAEMRRLGSAVLAARGI